MRLWRTSALSHESQLIRKARMYRLGNDDIKSENIRAYSKQFATYDAEMHRDLGSPELDADRMGRHVKWEKGGVVLEVGAGTGYAY